jgi:hypothetical protein
VRVADARPRTGVERRRDGVGSGPCAPRPSRRRLLSRSSS